MNYIASFFSATDVPEKSTFSFKNKYTFEKRRSEYEKIHNKYPDKVIVVLEDPKYHTNAKDKTLKRICPFDMSVGQLRFYIRKKRVLDESQSIILFVNNVIPKSNEFMGTINEKYQDDDGFLYISYMIEDTFG